MRQIALLLQQLRQALQHCDASGMRRTRLGNLTQGGGEGAGILLAIGLMSQVHVFRTSQTSVSLAKPSQVSLTRPSLTDSVSLSGARRGDSAGGALGEAHPHLRGQPPNWRAAQLITPADRAYSQI